MKVSVDTNVLVRCAVRDDEAQARVAEKTLKGASLIAVALPTLCEFVWVLRSVYGFADTEIGSAVRALLSSEKVVCDRLAAEAGLALLEAGGDFADGVIAHEGTWLGAETFLSFDKAAVAMLSEQGYVAKHLR